ncbi:hypothetical protein GTZ99_12560 [Novosphingobium sp. FSY-8]|uniref:Uncharacterized protein n=1 Tax=Novosphingobium ovatum TaxID=1908523 RepID=A0ABW9XFR7_9SPHN|nr:hypothetical protein [Novosphingobium ovatum]NBC37383.1 hypothetical protein [Novosphingobium ovatum]
MEWEYTAAKAAEIKQLRAVVGEGEELLARQCVHPEQLVCGEYGMPECGLRAQLAEAVAIIGAINQHDQSNFHGANGDKNARAAWRGVVRKARAFLAKQAG